MPAAAAGRCALPGTGCGHRGLLHLARTRTLAQLQALFVDGIARRIVGATPRWHTVDVSPSLAGYRRQAEIQGWLNRYGRGWEPWVALDDQPWLFRPFLENLIRVRPETGLTDENCRDLLRRLQLQDTGR